MTYNVFGGTLNTLLNPIQSNPIRSNAYRSTVWLQELLRAPVGGVEPQHAAARWSIVVDDVTLVVVGISRVRSSVALYYAIFLYAHTRLR